LRRVSLAAFALIVAFGILGGFLLGCHSDTGIEPKVVDIVGPYFADKESISPSTPPAKDATLTLSGSPFKVTVKTEKRGTHYRIFLMNDGEEFDREEYEDSFQAFRLLQAGGEHYEPPIDLLQFPMNVGKSWEWKGQIVVADNPQAAEAKVETAEDKQIVDGAPMEAVRVTVTLKFTVVAGGKNEVAQRVLTFWFAKDQGLFRRQYDWVSVREPAK
jgi:hypothetical protein